MCVPKEPDHQTVHLWAHLKPGNQGPADRTLAFLAVSQHACCEPLDGLPTEPPQNRPPPPDLTRRQGVRANVPPEVLEELDEAMVGEPQGRCRVPSQRARTQQLGTLVRQLRPF